MCNGYMHMIFFLLRIFVPFLSVVFTKFFLSHGLQNFFNVEPNWTSKGARSLTSPNEKNRMAFLSKNSGKGIQDFLHVLHGG